MCQGSAGSGEARRGRPGVAKYVGCVEYLNPWSAGHRDCGRGHWHDVLFCSKGRVANGPWGASVYGYL